jgi:hypothetical protein
MKKVLFLLVVCFLVFQNLQAQSDGFDRFVRKMKKIQENGEKHDITLPGFLVRFGVNFVDDADLEGVNLKAVTRKISELRIVMIEGSKGVEEGDYKNFLEEVKAEGFEDLLVFRDNTDKIRIMIKERKNLIRNVVIMVDEKGGSGEFILLNLEGKFTMDDVNKLVKNVEIDGIGKKHKTKSVKTVRD